MQQEAFVTNEVENREMKEKLKQYEERIIDLDLQAQKVTELETSLMEQQQNNEQIGQANNEND